MAGMKPSIISLSTCAVATPSSVPSTATPSDVGSLHDEPLLLDDFVEIAVLNDCLLSPSKSFRRRLRRKRQAEAVKASAAVESITYAETDSRSCPSQVVTLEDLSFGLLSPCGGVVDAKLTLQSASPTPIGTHQGGVMTMMASPQACQASFCAGPSKPALPAGLDHCVTQPPFIVSTSPCCGTVVRGDASCRTPARAVGPAMGSSSLVVANPVLSQCYMTTNNAPLCSPTVGSPAHALWFLCGGSTPTSAEDLARQLQAAAPEVYED